MIRVQRRAHARIFIAFAPLLTAALIWALVQRQRTLRVLSTPALATTTTLQPEPSP